MRYAAFLLVSVFSVYGAPQAVSQSRDIGRFYPIEEGNVWEYVVDEWPPDESNERLMRLTVVGDTLINDEAYALVTVLKRTLSLEVIDRERCATRYDETELTIEWVSVDGGCEPFGSSEIVSQLDFGSGEPDSGEVLIAGLAYAVESIVQLEVMGSQSLVHNYLFAYDIGVTSYFGFIDFFGYRESSVTLVYAEVGETVYGLRPEEHDWIAFAPLAAGDMWEYAYLDHQGWSTYYGYAQVVAVADTTIADEQFVVATEKHFDQDTGNLIAEGRFALRLSDGRLQASSITPFRWDVDRPWGVSSILEKLDRRGHSLMRVDALRRGYDVEVSDSVYEADVILMDPFHMCSKNEQRYARGIGLVYLQDGSLCGSGGGRSSSRWTLTYARIGGEAFGHLMMPIEGGGGSSRNDGMVIEALYPNPARSGATFTMQLPTSVSIQLEVIDVLGRQVHRRDLGVQPAGSSQHRLDLVDMPAGLYIVRVTTASGETTTRRLVKVD